MRISDWSSDVCSSDLRLSGGHGQTAPSLPQRGFGDRWKRLWPERWRGGTRARKRRSREKTGTGSDGEDSGLGPCRGRSGGHGNRRSEEHTSELQSLMRISYAVFCLKKKTQTTRVT